MSYSILGVDSLAPANCTSQSGETLYDQVIAKYPKIRFWGRYIAQAKHFPNRLTPQECDFLHKRGISILLIFNETTNATVQSYQNGLRHAGHAIEAIRQIELAYKKVENYVFVYANIDSMMGSVAPHWIIGWWQHMWASRFKGAGGIYMGLDITTAYCTAFYHSLGKSDLIPTRNPNWQSNKLPVVFFPDLPTSSAIWTAPNVKAPKCRSFGNEIIRQKWGEKTFPAGKIDLNYASEEGLASMWHP